MDYSIFTSPQRDNGYDIADYRAVDQRFGTMADFEELTKEAKARDIGVMLDMVFNHTSTEHQWFKRAVAGEKEFQDYYKFVDGEPDSPPTNWVSKFGGNAWEYVPAIKKWYLHLFDVTQADLNWENPRVRQELKDIILFWKSKGVSGFRFDVINLISKPDSLQNDDIGDGRRFYTDGPKVHQYLKELVADTGIEEMITVGEMSSTSIDNCIKYSNPDEKELAMTFSFHHLKVDYKDGDKWSLMPYDKIAFKQLFKEWQEKMTDGNGWNALFLTNHDQPRIVSRFGDEKQYWRESAKLFAGVIHLMRGTPYVYQGEEIGMLNTHFTDINQYKDVESLNYYNILMEQGKNANQALDIINQRSRDNCRTPMQWDTSENDGFTTGKPWIEIPEYGKSITVSSQINDENSILAFYKKLIALRKQYRIISEGNISFDIAVPEQIISFQRKLEDECLYVIGNLGETETQITVSESLTKGQLLIHNYSDDVNIMEKSLNLRPYELLAILL